ncbi:MAG: DUF711 family protein [Chloroflexi bacterium]|jgi:hypothetical protein|nr:DUF711 family protein [Anaerolineaceae bacterium]NLI45305.1 DUF711 family protein [Chloroflexota bacterium]HOE35604.1 DUF711 family protein [Anaerolineaceae bacterium]HOT25255.1 DUF711 family protein [Anaerolineaceae bacterium]HQH57805.1 DUF711 family protein [Anaerolineaceae bacterium]
MKIRSITVFCALGYPANRLLLQHLGIFANHARALFTQEGFEVETLRLALPPFSEFVNPRDLSAAAQNLSIEAHAEGFEYLSLGPALTTDPEAYPRIPEALAKTHGVFFSGMLTTPQGEVSLPAAKSCAEIIAQLAGQSPDGFANLNFCASANVPPYAPFFPAAYAASEPPAFALAMEAADLAVSVFTAAGSLQEARANLIEEVEKAAQKLEAAANNLSRMYGYDFKGLDFTLAPFPEVQSSIGGALEALGLPAFGLAGSLFASAFLTDTLDRARFTRTGFNGLMLPVLEDSGLARRAAEGTLTAQDLLLCSAVCGTGLDVIPLPGDTSADQLYPLLLDVAALALRLGKPLTARLMPISGKKAGDPTEFDFPYFANSRVMPLRAEKTTGLLSNAEIVPLARRQPR